MTEEITETPIDGPIKPNGTADLWKHRRKLAYLSLFASMGIVGFTMVCILNDVDIKTPHADILSMSIIGFMSIVAAYMGFSTLAMSFKK